MTDDVETDVKRATLDYAEKLKQLGYEVEDVDLDMAKYSLAIYYIIVPAEVMSNLARYDGVHYGHRVVVGKAAKQGTDELIDAVCTIADEIKNR